MSMTSNRCALSALSAFSPRLGLRFGLNLSLTLGVVLGLVLLAGEAFAHGMSAAEKQAIIDGGNWSYLKIGATHMLSGYDHLAFVFGIVFFLTNFRDIVKYVTAFTLGHSATLIYATLNGIQLNYFLIDAVIALSVCYIAFHNIDGFRKYLGVNPPNMMAMIVGLGFIHGFGLSTRLQELPLNADNILMNIISFNVGIELGQIGALVVMLAVLALFRNSNYFPTFKTLTNSFLIFWGGFLFLSQMHGYEHSTNAAEPGIAAVANATSSAVPGTAAATGAATSAGAGATGGSQNWTDEIKVVVAARGDIEYKLLLKKAATFYYFWETDGAKLFYDFHGDKKDDTSGYFKSYGKSTDSSSAGALAAPFEGNHGWYWKNTTNKPVTVTLKVGGDYALKPK